MDPMGGQSAYAPAGHQQGGDGSGACSTCGRPLPPPDLEAVAAGIDQALSMEAGRMVERTAWAGRAPDGMMDSLFAFLPSVKAKRQLWERGQALWTERMTQAISGPCDSCRGIAGAAAMGTAPGSPQTTGPYAAGPATPTYGQPDQPPAPAQTAGPAPTSMMPGYGESGREALEDEYESRTSMMPPMTPTFPSPGGSSGQELAGTPLPEQDDEDSVTTALPSFLNRAAEPPAPENPAARPPVAASATPPPPPSPPSPDLSDEHESHTVMISAPANLRGGPRLVVLEGPVHGRQFGLGRQLTTIGRSIGCHVTVESDAVGYDHARIVRSDAGWRVEPIAGAGETYVNDDPVRDARPLQSGDVIRVGPARIRFESVG
jgi:hypothetical protein